ncbi:MAG TPA: chromate efflux transporter [Candidatus Marinimicrobia bacterium]|nr:chromate efflux transporter [Candidatus Neomarinimicrobiota bacterium]
MKVKHSKLAEVARLFFKLGCIAFGGPAAHIAMMEHEVVQKRRWIGKQHFLDLVGATNLIPGPNSTEMTMHCGYERAGIPGLFIAGACFIFPAVVISGLFAWLYANYGHLPSVEPFIFGIKPAVLAIIAAAILKLGRKALKGWELGILGALVLTASLAGFNEIIALLSAGVLGAFYFILKAKIAGRSYLFVPLLSIPVATQSVLQLSALKVFWIFLKVGVVLYGSGYVLFAYLDSELVVKGLMSRQLLIDAVAVGQFTPGPVLSTATFIGYQLYGLGGAIAATAGIFLPSFLLVLFLNPLIPKMRRSKPLGYFLDSVNIAAVAVMLSVLFQMSRETLTDWRSIVIAGISVTVTFGLKKINTVWIVLGGAVMGYALKLI